MGSEKFLDPFFKALLKNPLAPSKRDNLSPIEICHLLDLLRGLDLYALYAFKILSCKYTNAAAEVLEAISRAVYTRLKLFVAVIGSAVIGSAAPIRKVQRRDTFIIRSKL